MTPSPNGRSPSINPAPPEILETFPEPPGTPPEEDGLVSCPHCRNGRVEVERNGRVIVRACPQCRGNPGRILPEVIGSELCSGDDCWCQTGRRA